MYALPKALTLQTTVQVGRGVCAPRSFCVCQATTSAPGQTPISQELTLSKMIAFGWYGGKFSHLNWLLPLLPESQHYCEPFGGSAAVLINRKPSEIETYNDLDKNVVNFFKVLRENKEELIESIALTPFSRDEYLEAIKDEGEVSDLERARRFFILARQSRTGQAQNATPGRWAHCVLNSRAGMAAAVSRWLGSVEGLSEVAQRLLRVQIENLPAESLIKKYDSEKTLFYCDPPYVHSTRGDTNNYSFEMSDEEHISLAQTLREAKGKVAISGYHCDLMDNLYGDWHITEGLVKTAHSSKTERQEVLWTNYDPKK